MAEQGGLVFVGGIQCVCTFECAWIPPRTTSTISSDFINIDVRMAGVACTTVLPYCCASNAAVVTSMSRRGNLNLNFEFDVPRGDELERILLIIVMM